MDFVKEAMLKDSEKKPDAKKYLQQIRTIDTHINNRFEELHRWRMLAEKVTTEMNPAPAFGGNGKDKLGDAVSKIVDLEKEINEEIDRYLNISREVSDVLSNVKSEKQRAVLHKRYVLYKTWEQIACEMNYSYYGVCKLHGRALQSVEAILKEKSKS